MGPRYEGIVPRLRGLRLEGDLLHLSAGRDAGQSGELAFIPHPQHHFERIALVELRDVGVVQEDLAADGGLLHASEHDGGLVHQIEDVGGVGRLVARKRQLPDGHRREGLVPLRIHEPDLHLERMPSRLRPVW